MNLFELAARRKFRFESPRGLLTVEDLFTLPLTGAMSLNTVAQLVNRDVKAIEEENFVDAPKLTDALAVAKLDLVKRVIAVRKEEGEAADRARDVAAQKQVLLAALERKDQQDINEMSREELLEKLKSLS
ncbi:hypothetical protein CHUUTOTORO_02670 [Serratia phage vB_SmaM-ChuuTotoro]|nr:hypothetical protein CHUUTOTORO_02670 [Serratia phage vB_SmaM-ChuuTotoro]